ncbi:Sensor kinase, two-component system [Modestobacter italicus]|uniref:histidine kinase n=1 Tax=Modestobacter italicus (strain DSM 44449 / CECT 9708 / BC 501) TaxID=2732864 RepID=I4EWH0_MODI5|nr:ATP-binding protein [Modestobacter marinus]CCH87733.1 Sensor kinase, two-component system [Modestobacter marinus]
MDLDELRPLGLFAGTGEDQLAALVAAGTEVHAGAGDVVFAENRPAEHWWVLLDGRIDLLRHVGHEETRLGVMDVPGRWAGGFRAWDEHGVYLATGRAATGARVLRVPAEDLHRVWADRFPLGLHLVEGVSRSARNYESMARQREALAALGTLAAGLAHELNNPAAAASRAVDALGEAHEQMLDSLRSLAAAPVTAAQFAALDSLRQELAPVPPGDPLSAADREDALSDWLTGHGVRRDWVLAPALAAAGADELWCERAAEVLGSARLEPGLEWVVSTLAATALLAEVKESTRRISDLVAAARSYSQLDRASMQQTDVAEGLESTLVVLAHRIPAGVTVVREHSAAVPRIPALAAELNQVWTNLVDNALHALGGSGTLRVSSRVDGGDVVVEIADTGAGMSPETARHAFDPFFTTKGVGEGTGLGLDISRRIVDRHRGDIGIELRPGETVLRVRLPVDGAR